MALLCVSQQATRGVQKHHKKLFWKKYMTKTFCQKAEGKFVFPAIPPLRYSFNALFAFLCVLRAACCVLRTACCVLCTAC
jgi:hypothetical protein